MGNVLEFYLKMKDMMSGGLVKMAQTAKQSFNAVTGYANSVVSSNNKILNSFQAIINKIKQVGASLMQVGNQSVSGGGGGILGGGLLKKLSAVGALMGAFAFAKSSIAASMDFTTKQKTFEVLASSPQRGKDLASQLFNLKQDTIMGTSVYGNAQTMLGFGIKDNEVVKDLKMIGDIAIGDKDRMQSLTLAFSQTRAAGKLMGQDLLQYINAGFNPLQVMQEHWKEFGFKMAVTGGQLREMVEKGQISAAAVSKAFEIATGAGGRFHGMMDAIAQTSAGKLKMLEGHFAAFKIEVGKTLEPVTNNLIDTAGKLLDWLNIAKTAPEILRDEQSGISTLVSTITQLNEGNNTRRILLNDLTKSYPALFGNIDTEKIKNSELLDTLNNINKAYKEKIQLADAALNADITKQDNVDMQNLAAHVLKEIQYYKVHPEDQNPFFTQKYLSLSEAHKIAWTKRSYSKWGGITRYDNGTLEGLQAYYNEQILPNLPKTAAAAQAAEDNKNMLEMAATVKEAFNLSKDKTKLSALFGSNKKGLSEFASLIPQINYLAGGEHKFGTSDIAFIQKLRDLMTPGSSAPATGATDAAGNGLITGGNTASGIAGGGPRQINISVEKFTEKFIVNATTVKEGAEETKKIFEDMFLRLLNSGASVQ